MDKVKNIQEIVELTKELKSKNQVVVTTNGTFDILHYAHIHLFEKAKNEGDVLVVLINSDESVRRNKGPKRPIISQQERAKMISALQCVDYVTIFEEETPLNVLKMISPNKHIKGGSFDYNRMRAEKELIEGFGGEYKCFELEEGFSTTSIIEKILKSYGSN